MRRIRFRRVLANCLVVVTLVVLCIYILGVIIVGLPIGTAFYILLWLFAIAVVNSIIVNG